MRSRGLVLLAAALGGCAAVSPPPMTVRHQGPDPDPRGTIGVQLVLGAAAGPLAVDGGVGWLLQLRYQATDALQVGLEGGRAYNVDHGADGDTNQGRHPLQLNVLRLTGRYHAATAVTLEAGAGGGVADTGLTWLTGDVGLLSGGTFQLDGGSALVPYGGPTASVSVPLSQGTGLRRSKTFLGMGPDQRAMTTWHDVTIPTTWTVGATGGLGWRAAGETAARTSLELSLLFSEGASGAVILGASAAGGVDTPTR
ncbi:MAG: hypothetical protein H6704_02540 [Myxococcales bacterium]|nr:hypothetical protein [Myxococcales bacterium]